MGETFGEAWAAYCGGRTVIRACRIAGPLSDAGSRSRSVAGLWPDSLLAGKKAGYSWYFAPTGEKLSLKD